MGPVKRIAIDAMGGDGGAKLTVPAAIQALSKFPDIVLSLVGDQDQINSLFPENSQACARLQVVHAPDVIADEDNPGNVLRSAKQSSMYLATKLVKNEQVQAMVSAGNTGALLMIGRHLLKTIPGIHKPAIVATIPGASRQTYLLDVGANPDCSAQQLFEFAVMGSVLAESLDESPARVALLNIGAEQYKGTDEVRHAAERLQQCPQVNYVGFVEANELFEGLADVVVCDGFVGNVTIKSSAGVANVVKKLLAGNLEGNFTLDSSSTSVVTRLAAQINPQRFNGASLLGLQGSIIKSHGNATEEGFVYAIQQAVTEIENTVPQLIAEKVASIIAAN
ncbi:MAG: phosphate acyltransferase PlsX [Gammaproteobacteria bacterium]|nr:phosphate acyltransferase PlsX [Gammaproteobacteria bacterium]MDD9896369.1 phosphate acyltransferase PlsX [Gammaproteobacteria bacterium]